MAQFRVWGPALLAVAITLSVVTSAHPDDKGVKPAPPASSGKPAAGPASYSTPAPLPASYSTPAPLPASNGKTCVIYRLDGISADPELGQWIADTIPSVVEPGTWNQPASSPMPVSYGSSGSYGSSTILASGSSTTAQTGSQPALRYYAPKKLLVVYHTAAVHAKVEAFLKEVKHSLPKDGAPAASRAVRDPAVVRTAYSPPALIKAASPIEPATGYPVPATPRAPKHLFHFIIRYEGEGIVDDNVAKVVKAQFDKDVAEKSTPADSKKEEKEEKKETAPAAASTSTPAATAYGPSSAGYGSSPATATPVGAGLTPPVPTTSPAASTGPAPSTGDDKDAEEAETVTDTGAAARKSTEGKSSKEPPKAAGKKKKKPINPDRVP